MINAAAAAATSADSTGFAIADVIAFIVIWSHALHAKGKGTIPGRLLGIVLVLIVVWVLLAVTVPATAIWLASGAASGLVALAHGVSHL